MLFPLQFLHAALLVFLRWIWYTNATLRWEDALWRLYQTFFNILTAPGS